MWFQFDENLVEFAPMGTAFGGSLSQDLPPAARTSECHCEERSDVAIRIPQPGGTLSEGPISLVFAKEMGERKRS